MGSCLLAAGARLGEPSVATLSAAFAAAAGACLLGEAAAAALGQPSLALAFTALVATCAASAAAAFAGRTPGQPHPFAGALLGAWPEPAFLAACAPCCSFEEQPGHMLHHILDGRHGDRCTLDKPDTLPTCHDLLHMPGHQMLLPSSHA